MNFKTFLPIGDPRLDDDHRRLESAIDVLASSQKQDRATALLQLRQIAAAHFESEDADLSRMGDGNAKCHVDEHAEVLKSLDEVRLELASPEREEAFKEALTRRLAEQLAHWLPMHVREMDAALVKFRVAQRFGGVPVTLQTKSR
jgi:hemerythrin-like metal-binding protein